MENKEIIDSEVVITTKVDLGEFVAERRASLDFIDEEMSNLKKRQEAILLELSNLLK
jgi:hypothetical protein